MCHGVYPRSTTLMLHAELRLIVQARRIVGFFWLVIDCTGLAEPLPWWQEHHWLSDDDFRLVHSARRSPLL